MPGVHVDVALNDLNATWEQEHAEHQIVVPIKVPQTAATLKYDFP
jgi:hypothetical protein